MRSQEVLELNNNFIDLLRFCNPESLQLNEHQALAEIETYIETGYAQKGTNYNIIPIERVLYIRSVFMGNERVQQRINELFHLLARVYEKREKLLSRIQLQGYSPVDANEERFEKVCS